MIIRCTKCSTEFALDPSQVGAEGVTLRCSVCSHMFHAEPDPEAIPAPWKVQTTDRHSLSFPDLRRVLEHLADGRLKPDDQLSHTGTNWIRLAEVPEFSSLFIGVEGLPRVFKAVESSGLPDLPSAHGDDVRREETVRVRVQNVLGGRASLRDDGPLPGPLPAPPDFASDAPRHDPAHDRPRSEHAPRQDHAPAPPARHMTQEFVSRGAEARTSRSPDTLPAPPDFGARAPGPRGNPLVGGPIVGGPVPAESGALPAPPDFASADDGHTRRERVVPDTRAKKAPASMLEAVTKVVAGDERDAPETEASRSRSQPILVADLARAAAAHAEKTVQAVDSQRARERAARTEAELSTTTSTSTGTTTGRFPREPELTSRPESTTGRLPRIDAETSTGATVATGRVATAAAVSAAMAIARESTREPLARTGATERAPLDNPRVTERLPADRTPGDRTVPTPRPLEPSASLTPPAVAEDPGPPRAPEVVIVKVAEPARGGSGMLFAVLGIAAAAAIVFGVPTIRERVFNLGQPTPVTKAEPNKTAAPAMPTEEFKQARAAIRSLGLKETNKAQTALQRIVDDPKRPPAAVAQAKQLLAELLLARALACQIAVALEPSAMGGEAQARGTEDPPAARELLDSLGADAPPDADTQRHITALEALVAGQSPAVAAVDAELSALVRAAPLWRGQIKTPPSGLISTLQRLPTPSTLSQSVLALALVRSGDETSAREQLLAILKTVPDQPVARTLLDLLDRQGMMTEAGDPEAPAAGDPIPTLPPDPAPVEPGKTSPRPTGTGPAANAAVEALISTGCQQVRAGDPEGVKLLLAAIERGAKPRDNFNLCFCLGNGFARQNAHDTAFTWYSRAVEQSPTNRDAVAGAARSAELLGRTSTAVEYYKKLRALEPTNSAANAYLNKHDQSAAPPPDVPEPGDEVPPELMGVPTRKKTP